MLAKEILQKVRKIQLKVSKLSTDVVSGHYLSAFKGSGIEFDEVQEYIPGDDVRAIDWNVTARTGSPYIKRYVEERELTVVLVVDLSASQRFGTVNTLKSELSAEIAALLAFLAINNNDKVALLIFSDHCELYLPPQKGRKHVLRVIREILAYQPSGVTTNLQEALGFINRVIKHRGIVFILSDFIATDFEPALKSMTRRHDVVAISLEDPGEFELLPLGLIELQDSETGERVLVDTESAAVREVFQRNTLARIDRTVKLFNSCKVDYLRVSTAKPYINTLQQFFLIREHRIR
ncbi:MAG TPA: DUF58 domain-containing protein [Bacillota bacterium]